MSNVREFIDNLDENVMSLGLDSRFKENPAYKKSLDEIRYLVMEMNMGDNEDKVYVIKEDNTFEFSWQNPFVEKKHNLRVWVSQEKDQLFCEEIIDSVKKDESKRDYKERFVVIIGSQIDTNKNIEIIKKYGSADNQNCEYGKCNTLCGMEKKKYDRYGVQEKEERETFYPGLANEDVTRIQPMGILTVTRSGFNSNYWKQRIIATREYLDVVSITFDDKNTGEKFIGKQEINQEHGLQDLNYSTFHLSEHEIIHPLMNAEIEKMLSKEDPIVAEGLRRYAEGRDRFSYDSTNEKDCQYKTSQR